MKIEFDTRSPDAYRMFLKVRNCPVYHFRGTAAIVPDEYASSIGMKGKRTRSAKYDPNPGLFDYQRDITAKAIQKRKYAIFADCGLGKTMMILEYARHAAKATGGRVLIVSPLMVCNQRPRSGMASETGSTGFVHLIFNTGLMASTTDLIHRLLSRITNRFEKDSSRESWLR
jgi:hypothetical protein